MAERLFAAFADELREDRAYDHEFTMSPYDPAAKMRELVDRAGADAAPLLVAALGRDRDLAYWACVGLGWLGPAAGEAAVAALVELVGAEDRGLSRAAAAALDAIAPARARALGLHRAPATMGAIADRYVNLGGEAVADYVAWFAAHESDEDVVRLLGHWGLRTRLCRDGPALLPALYRSGRSAALRRAVAEILALAHVAVAVTTEELIDGLAHGGPVPLGAIVRVAAHPASDRLIPALISAPDRDAALTELIARRRCAGLATDPAPLRAYVREHSAVGAVAELRDETLLEDLLPLLRSGVRAAMWEGLVHAFWSFGARGRAMLQQERRRHPGHERIGWALDAVAHRPDPAGWLELADRDFLAGRIDTSAGHAFRAYGHALLAAPSAYAAFQLAWIDRAFGVPITAERVEWVRSLGFADDMLLGELGRRPDRPLEGARSVWDPGPHAPRDPVRAAQAVAAGLPSLAVRWYDDGLSAHAAQIHVERARRASFA